MLGAGTALTGTIMTAETLLRVDKSRAADDKRCRRGDYGLEHVILHRVDVRNNGPAARKHNLNFGQINSVSDYVPVTFANSFADGSHLRAISAGFAGEKAVCARAEEN
jgi:hypothetical protein